MRLLALALGFLPFTADAFQDDPIAERWAELLGHENAAVRRDAEAALARMGDQARPALAAALASPDPERAARARTLYRPLAASRLELSLKPGALGGSSLFVHCFLKNPDRIPLVAVRSHFHYQSRVLWALCEQDAPPNWKTEFWRHGCSDVHPFEKRDFILIPPGETREIGWVELPIGRLPAGRSRIAAKYVFRRPLDIDPRYFASPELRRLFYDAVEVDGIVAPPVEIDVPAASR